MTNASFVSTDVLSEPVYWFQFTANDFRDSQLIIVKQMVLLLYFWAPCQQQVNHPNPYRIHQLFVAPNSIIAGGYVLLDVHRA